MPFQILLLSVTDKKAEYFIKKYLVDDLHFSSETTKEMLSALPAAIWEADDEASLQPMVEKLTQLGGITQINYPNQKYCPHHIDQVAIEPCSKCQEMRCKRCQDADPRLCTACKKKKESWHRFKRYRQAVAFLILLVVLGVAARIRYVDTRKLDWDRTYNVALIEIVKLSSNKSQPVVSLPPGKKEEMIKLMENWFASEALRIRNDKNKPFRFKFIGPIKTEEAAPHLPSTEDSWWQRYKQTSAFVKYFNDRIVGSEIDDSFDIRLFLYLYPVDERLSYDDQHSVATTRGRFGVVFIPITKQSLGSTVCTISHELLHTVGASDKYTENHQTAYPVGYFQPEPRYPQQFGEIMSLAIPLAPGKERDLDSLDLARIGSITTKEIGWTKE